MKKSRLKKICISFEFIGPDSWFGSLKKIRVASDAPPLLQVKDLSEIDQRKDQIADTNKKKSERTAPWRKYRVVQSQVALFIYPFATRRGKSTKAQVSRPIMA